MESELELKSSEVVSRVQRESELTDRLASTLSGYSVNSIAKQTGYHAETVRRYLIGGTKVPADFVGQVVREFGSSAQLVLIGDQHTPDESELRMVTTDRLINELGRRITLIEECSVGSVILKKGLAL